MLQQYPECSAFFVNEHTRVVREGYLPQRTIQISIWDVEIKVANVSEGEWIAAATKYTSTAGYYRLI
ncbi:MAG: hypothetical protein ACTS73_06525 [Arsenophonus sp. NEOnobi-MAG3]